MVGNMQQSRVKKVYGIVMAVSLVLLIGLMVASGYLQYLFAYGECGKKPTLIRPTFEGLSGYVPPEDTTWYEINPFNRYYCSVEEAKAKGYQLSTFSEEYRRTLK